MNAAKHIEKTILELLHHRGADKTICPSEVARQLWPQAWREHMEQVRAVAMEMAEANRIEITQHGVHQAPRSAKGAIRLRMIS